MTFIEKQTDGSVVLSVGTFELCGAFSDQCLDAFKTMAERYSAADPYNSDVTGRVEGSLTLIVEVCTNSPESMSDQQLIVAFDFVERLIANS